MVATVLRANINKYGIENLRVIIIDNSRNYTFDSSQLDAGMVVFNDTDGYLEFKEIGRGGKQTIVVLPYEVIQTLIFDDPTPEATLPYVYEEP
jgi:hypothetical protein